GAARLLPPLGQAHLLARDALDHPHQALRSAPLLARAAPSSPGRLWRTRSRDLRGHQARSRADYAVPQLEWTPGRGYVEPLRGGGEWGNFAGAPMGAGCSRPPSRRSRSTASSGARLRFRGLRVSWTSAP